MANLFPYKVTRPGSKLAVTPRVYRYQFGDGYEQVEAASNLPVEQLEVVCVLARSEAKSLTSWLQSNLVFLMPNPLDTGEVQQWQWVSYSVDTSQEPVQVTLSITSIRGSY